MAKGATERTGDARAAKGSRVEPLLFLALPGARLGDGGARVALRDVEALEIGRGEERRLSRVRWTIPDPRMSDVHARIVKRGARFVLEDLDSTNGTLVDGEAVRAAELADGQVLELGQTVFVYRELVCDGSPVGNVDARDFSAVPVGFATLDPLLAARFARLERVAASKLNVLLVGATGTGKEVLARAMHAVSKRPGPFVAVNCGAIPANLVETHLFGHLRGAFSGALRDEPGYVRAANFGTLLLDEIGDLPESAQAALLRVLQEGEVVPVGSTQPVRVDVRVLGATHKPLEEMVERGSFRQDLYARLAGYVFTLPALRERKVDLGMLIAALSRGVAGGAELRLHREAARAMLNYDWPMNVRELEQCLHASGVLADGGTITADDLPVAIAAARNAKEETFDDGAGRDDELRRELLMRLSETNGNVSEVARAMGKARQQVQRWTRRFGIDPEAYKKK